MSSDPTSSFRVAIDKPSAPHKAMGDMMFISLNDLEPVLFVVDGETSDTILATAISEIPGSYQKLINSKSAKQIEAAAHAYRMAEEAAQLVRRLAQETEELRKGSDALERLLTQINLLKSKKKH